MTSSDPAIEKQIDLAQETAKDRNAYTFEKKAEFVAAMNKQLLELENNLAELSTKVEKSSDKVKTEAKPKLAALKEQTTLLRNQIAGVAMATPTTWDGIKADSNKAYRTLRDGIDQSRQWLSEKIAP